MNRSLTGNHVSWLDPQMMICEEPCLGLPGVCQESMYVDTAFKGSFGLLLCFDFYGKGVFGNSYSYGVDGIISSDNTIRSLSYND